MRDDSRINKRGSELITYLSLKITHQNPIDQLATIAAGRVYTLTGVDDCEVITEFPALKQAEEVIPNGHGHDAA